MSDQIYKHQSDLIKLIESHTDQDGSHATAIPSLFFSRYSNVTGPHYGVYKPSMCIIVQGKKEVVLAKEHYVYGPADYLISSVNLPVTGIVTEASSENPYLALKLEFTPNQILQVLQDSQLVINQKENAKRGMYVSQIELSLLETVNRLVRLLDHPNDISVLAPLIMKEIIYRVLQGQHGLTLGQIAIEGSSANQIGDVVDHIMINYNQSFRIEDLAEIANMSVSSLHRHFKVVTAMSPIQFQKQLRLQEARRILLSESTDAIEAAFRVGYESPSQFSREYSRLFGLPPKEDINRLKATYL
ncbi:AraC family transcriptional regulator [Bacillus sp. EAC]|uniref:AraC family transcriptional regulator n=1 Tax=Bacillus sp. EAC TaxID=1978338 RepID=UPI000B44111C|nr:AraC family transcriptional regulator [Bacillus sp. EAC]